jgi:dipeptidyl aminopeptidase/acylaminoacyl peptidase
MLRTEIQACSRRVGARAWSRGVCLLAGAVLLVPLLSCQRTTDDGGDGTPTPTPGSVWIEQAVLGHEDGIVRERVAYRSGSLKIYAEICRPDDAGQHSVVLWSHGGFAGLFDADREACRQIAKAGFVLAASYYRGEGGSDGQVEACKGEVDDVSALLDAVKQQTYANPSRIAAIGASHGGCVTLQLATRRSDLRAAVDFSGPANWSELYNWWTAQLAAGEPRCTQIGRTDCRAIHEDLSRQLRESMGGTPAQAPQAYADRSPALKLAQLEVPTLIAHGLDDIVINVEQTCEKREALIQAGKTPASWYLDKSLHERTDRDTCGGGFRQASVVLSATQKYALVLYEGQGHGFDTAAARDHAIALAVAFALAHL